MYSNKSLIDELTKKKPVPLYYFWMVDSSGSMYGEKIATVNNAIQSGIQKMQNEIEKVEDMELFIRVLKFSTGALWQSKEPVNVRDFVWTDLEADGLTAFGEAVMMITEQLNNISAEELEKPPVIVLVSDGRPTDEYLDAMANMKQMPWFENTVRIAVAIGRDVDERVLFDFTQNKGMIFKTKDQEELQRILRFVTSISAFEDKAGIEADIVTEVLSEPDIW